MNHDYVAVYQTTDAGQTGFLTVGHYPAAGDLLVSRDGGATWQLRRLPAGAGQYPQIKFFSASSAIIVPTGPQGTIGVVFYITADGGRRWTALPQGRYFRQLGASVEFVSTRDGFAWVTGTSRARGSGRSASSAGR